MTRKDSLSPLKLLAIANEKAQCDVSLTSVLGAAASRVHARS